jgi:hypothetical protein
MISVNQSSFATLQGKLTAFLKERVPGVKLESMSVLDDRVNLNYLYRRRTGFDWTTLTNDLMQLAGPTKVEIFIG